MNLNSTGGVWSSFFQLFFITCGKNDMTQYMQVSKETCDLKGRWMLICDRTSAEMKARVLKSTGTGKGKYMSARRPPQQHENKRYRILIEGAAKLHLNRIFIYFTFVYLGLNRTWAVYYTYSVRAPFSIHLFWILMIKLIYLCVQLCKKNISIYLWLHPIVVKTWTRMTWSSSTHLARISKQE